MEKIKRIDYYRDCEDIMFPDVPISYELDEVKELRNYNYFVINLIRSSEKTRKCQSGVRYK